LVLPPICLGDILSIYFGDYHIFYL
jgi:hypothetical protein